MQPEQCQDKQRTDPVAPRKAAWCGSLDAFMYMLNIGNVTLLQEMIWIHSCETLLLERVYSVRNTLECSGILEKKERQVLRVLSEQCCRSNEIRVRGRRGRNRMGMSMDFTTHTSDSRRAVENPSRHSPLRSTVHQA